VKYFSRYISKSPVILGNKSDYDRKIITSCKFNFPQLTIGMRDSFQHDADIVKHIGLEFIIEGEAPNKEIFTNTSHNNVETLLNLISFSSMGYCFPAKLVNVTESNDEGARYASTFYIHPFEDDGSFGFKIPFDASLFGEIFSHYDASACQQLVMRTLTWLRKGLKEDGADRFFSFWLGLEAVKPLVDARQDPSEKLDEWDGIKRIFSEKLNNNEFLRIKNELKDPLFNGTHELSTEFISEITKCNELLLKCLLFSLFEVLGLNERYIEKILPNTSINRIERNTYCVLIGELESFPSNFNNSMTQYPHLEVKNQLNKSLGSSPYDFKKMTSSVELELDNRQNNNFWLKERQFWINQQSMVDQQKLSIAVRMKDFKKDNLEIKFDVGKEKVNSNERSIIFKPWGKAFDRWTSPGKISYLFLTNKKDDLVDLSILGGLCYSPGEHIIFFPGFEYEYLTKFDDTFQIGEKSNFFIDHFTLLKEYQKWHITGLDADNKIARFSFPTNKISDNLYYWFGMNIRQDVFFETLCKSNILQYNCPVPVFDTIKEIIVESRRECNDYVILPNDAREDRGNAFYHFDFYFSKSESVNYPLDLILEKNKLIKPRLPSDHVPVTCYEIKIPSLDGKIIIASTLISGDLSDLIILSMKKK